MSRSERSKLRISGFSVVRNGSTFDYPYLEAFRSLLPLVDELVINVGIGTDNTRVQIESLKSEFPTKDIVILESEWNLDDPEKRKGGRILSEQTNLALERCTGDWCFYLQADEVLHEEDGSKIRHSIWVAHSNPEIEAIVFNYRHLYGSYNVEQYTRSAYRREVRLVRKSANLRSVGDAQSFRRLDGSKPIALLSSARIFHYGWVRTPEAMKQKTTFMDSLYHGAKVLDDASQGRDLPTKDNYLYKRFWGLRPFKEEHPSVMRSRIQEKNWNWDFAHSPFVWVWQDTKKVALDLWESITGHRAFEYKSYRLMREPSLLKKPIQWSSRVPTASIFLSTYNMPRHLELVLTALLRQTHHSFELWVCDDGSHQETRLLVQKFSQKAPFPIHYLWQENKGFRKCKILNNAIRKASGQLAIFLDGDCVPHPAFVQDHLAEYRPGFYSAGRRVDVEEQASSTITPELVQSGQLDYPWPFWFRARVKGQINHLQRTLRLPFEPLRTFLGMKHIDDMKGCNFSVAMSDLRTINGFDEEYEGYGREDTDLEIRMRHYGLQIRSLKGLALQYHVWHPRREFTPANESLLTHAKNSFQFRCKKGLE